MKRFKKAIALALCLTLVMLMLAACGGSGDTPASEAAPTDEATSGEAVADNNEGGADSDEIVELSVMGWQPNITMMNEVLIPAITEKYPNIKINVQILDWFAYWEKLTIESAAGQAPDIAVLDKDHLATYAEYYRPLDDLAADVMGEDWQSQFNDGVLDTLVTDGSTRAIPSETTGLWYLFYNKSLCDELGVEAPTGNYDELVEWIAKVNATNSGTLPLAFAGKEDVNVGFFWMWLASNIQEGIVADAAEGRASFTDQPFVTAFEQITEMMDNGFLDEKVFGLDAYPGADDLFKGRNCVAYLSGQWYMGGYLIGSQVGGTNIENDELGIVTLENVAGGQTVMQKYVAQCFGISNNCEYPEEAMKVIQEWTTGPAAQVWQDYQACVPAAKSVTLDTGLMKTQEAKDTVGAAIDALHNNPNVQRSTLNSALDNKIGELVVSVLRMGIDPADALEQMQQAAEELRE